MSEWILFSEGFPLTANVKEIEVYYDDVNPANNAVRTATYGRGLWSSPGYYGVPTANFISNETNIPMGCGIDFFDKSSGVPHQWNWSFEGATPASSTEQNPTNIKYLTEGTFEVSLTVTNPSGDNTKIISGFITVNGATLPQVDFKAADTVQCTTETAKLIDLSLGCPTAWNWSFEPNTVSFVNGTDQNSQNPEVNFTEAAVYSVSLTVTNAAGNSDLTKQNYISVGGQSIPFTENFDDVTLEANGWTVNNPDGKKTWELKSVAGPMGESNASWINFFNYTSMNARDYLNSPLLSFVGYQNVLMSFDYAYAQRYSQVDSLIVNISNDCGETWTKVYANGPDGNGIFETAEPTSNSFEPTSNAEWAGNGYGAAKPIIDLSSWAGQGNIMLQFESYNKYGNNLYIDNIEISNTVGINELKTENGFVMYPNPANSVLNIYVDSKKEAKTLHILNLQGKIVSEIALKEGNNKINVGNLSKGIYFAQIKGTISNKTSKLIIQ
jgi:PKD repeat protein